ncbi:holliday junction resolvasome helicase subunit A [Corynebacterium kutscheri]|uniref:Holliday junction branch migration complex subunit RuvA n=1 Tax=Corynebacterium kutscheri TaxID=35755 RepID=A0A0F6TDK9_9CORY|nr:Holliday junction branch migration protein RuvA [Corynebacterium kutscheri]AKE41346.1 Holliday junction DNA helicase subunit RuvA [Corynebacterium kutscheri]VEH08622.1 holliday junction resolvasome helicase subunit A [Corynebacterium kutscheri]VEH09668.1 holliday junction resolvasome helicase subunit A [Corynebacterium kutscheri]VEH79751.1 holliday junction resolvasome helicase subunit A [Corynebacterium kutscheri]
MIASLRGKVIAKGLDHFVIECHGVGYQVQATAHTLGQLRCDEEAFVLTTMVVREDSQVLYGFLEEESRKMFALLQIAKGLGPRLALAAQSVLSATEIAQAISNKDAKTLQKIPGVGAKVADRLVLELKDKVAGFGDTATDMQLDIVMSASGSEATKQQVLEALIGLGFSEKQAEPVLVSVLANNPEAETASVLRATLSALGKK